MPEIYTRNSTIHTIIFDDGVTLETKYGPPCDWIEPLAKRVDDQIMFAYVCVDDYPPNPKDDYEGEGEVILFSHHYSGHDKIKDGLAALGLDEDGRPYIEVVAEDIIDDWIAAEPGRHLLCAREMHRRHVAWHGGDDLSDEDLVEEYPVRDCAYDLFSDFLDGGGTPEFRLPVEFHGDVMKEWDRRRGAGEIGVKYTQKVDVYEHGAIHVSLSGAHRYPDEQWDVSRGGGVWVPDKVAIENLDDAVVGKTPEEAREIVRKYAAGCVEMWNQYWNGDVYVVCVEEHNLSGDDNYGDDTLVEEENCGGYYGSDGAKEQLEIEIGWREERLANKGEN